MEYPRFNPVKDAKNLRERVSRFLSTKRDTESDLIIERAIANKQLGLFDNASLKSDRPIEAPNTNLNTFFDLISHAIPEGDVYIFGGILRDLAFFGSRGFSSDVDLVVEGDWNLIVPRMERLGAIRNKFGGLRFEHIDTPIDIWLANETWAVRNGFVCYKGISSLLDTTILNWDSILMNWRTKSIICRPNYFEDINKRYMDLVLKENPNPLGMIIRILRQLISKDAQVLSTAVVDHLTSAAKEYSYREVHECEITSYRDSLITEELYTEFLTDRLVTFERAKGGNIFVRKSDRQTEVWSTATSSG